MNPEHVQWSRNTFNLLSLNGTWGLPGSGLVFQKVSRSELRLIAVLPWSKEMGQGARQGRDLPSDAMEFRLAQQNNYDLVSKHFGAAGVNVTDPKQLLKD